MNHVACASRRLRAAAVRGRLLPLLPVPLHQRPDRHRSNARARLECGGPRPAHVRLFPGVRGGRAPLRRAPRPLRAAPYRQCPAAPCRGRIAAVRRCRWRGDAPRRPRAHRSRRGRRPDGRSQGHRPVVPAGARRPRQWLLHHAGRFRCSVRDRAGRGGRSGLGWRGFFAALAVASAAVALLILLVVPEAGPPGRRLTQDRLPRHLPGPALPAHRTLGSPRRRARPSRCRACGRHRGSRTLRDSTAPPSSDTPP
jgi:hypothetical protein